MQLPLAVARLPEWATNSALRSIACCDFLARRLGAALRASGADIRVSGGGWSSAKGGELEVDTPGQVVLERTAVLFAATAAGGCLEARFTCALPAQGRTVLGAWAAQARAHAPLTARKGEASAAAGWPCLHEESALAHHLALPNQHPSAASPKRALPRTGPTCPPHPPRPASALPPRPPLPCPCPAPFRACALLHLPSPPPPCAGAGAMPAARSERHRWAQPDPAELSLLE